MRVSSDVGFSIIEWIADVRVKTWGVRKSSVKYATKNPVATVQ